MVHIAWRLAALRLLLLQRYIATSLYAARPLPAPFLQLEKYEVVPSFIQEKIVAEAKGKVEA